MDLTTVVGLAAGLLTTLSLVPQVTKIWKTRSAKDVSRRMFIAFCLGVSLWLVYGVAKGDLPMIIWNSISLALALGILGMKLRFG
jgi:MtN3 and saliva related transmembrane protein